MADEKSSGGVGIRIGGALAVGAAGLVAGGCGGVVLAVGALGYGVYRGVKALADSNAEISVTVQEKIVATPERRALPGLTNGR